MTQRVLVTIRGVQLQGADSKEDVIEAVSVGQLSEIGSKVYVKYEEVIEGTDKPCSNLIKIDEDSVEIIKKGPASVKLQFIKDKRTVACYKTAFGNIYMDIFSTNIQVLKTQEIILINLEYCLSNNNENISDNKVNIEIKPMT